MPGTRSIRMGPGWIFLVRLDEDGNPIGDYINLLYNETMSFKSKGKLVEVTADNAPSPIFTIGTGLETCSLEGDFKKYSLDQFNLFMGQGISSISGSVMDIHGTGASQRVQVQAWFANWAKEPDLWAKIENPELGGVEGFDLYEFRMATLGGEEIERSAALEKESVLKFMAKAQADIEISAIPARAQFGVEAFPGDIFKLPILTGFPITLFPAD